MRYAQFLMSERILNLEGLISTRIAFAHLYAESKEMSKNIMHLQITCKADRMQQDALKCLCNHFNNHKFAPN